MNLGLSMAVQMSDALPVIDEGVFYMAGVDGSSAISAALGLAWLVLAN